MDIEFDPAKRAVTLARRGLDFQDAGAVFEGPIFTMVDDRVDYGERRSITAGMLGRRMVVIVWAWRGRARRVISMRKANDRERARYEGKLGRSG